MMSESRAWRLPFPVLVTPAEAGVHEHGSATIPASVFVNARLRGHDDSIEAGCHDR